MGVYILYKGRSECTGGRDACIGDVVGLQEAYLVYCGRGGEGTQVSFMCNWKATGIFIGLQGRVEVQSQAFTLRSDHGLVKV